ncbi:MAG: efflux RND transporter periplasmic adaptor subunit [Gemmatimonadetes bacterium]|nr:efflux RND transporter periplasmic adaptor subunit [Gemmatimonadota bacterium]
MNRKRWLLIGGAGLVVILIVVSVLTSRESGITVEYEEVTHHDLTAIVSASGEIEPKQSVSISATTPGEVVRIGVTEGQRVNKGDFLLQLDPVNVAAGASGQAAALEAARAELESARAQAEYARQEYGRRNALAERDLIPRSELDAALAELRAREAAVAAARNRVGQAEASLRSARHDLARVTIRSPIDGVVTRVNVEEGEVAMIGTMNQPGTVLLSIADLGVMEATVEVDETDVVSIDTGQPARVTVDAFPDTTFQGTVTEVATSPKVQPTASGPGGAGATDFEVTITLEGTLPAARSGLSASAEIVTATRENALVIPIQSLVVRPVAEDTASGGVVEREGVFVVRDGRAHFVPVKVGIAGDRFFEVERGLEEGARVVSGPYQALRDLRDGQIVEAEEAEREGPLSARRGSS